MPLPNYPPSGDFALVPLEDFPVVLDHFETFPITLVKDGAFVERKRRSTLPLEGYFLDLQIPATRKACLEAFKARGSWWDDYGVQRNPLCSWHRRNVRVSDEDWGTISILALSWNVRNPGGPPAVYTGPTDACALKNALYGEFNV